MASKTAVCVPSNTVQTHRGFSKTRLSTSPYMGFDTYTLKKGSYRMIMCTTDEPTDTEYFVHAQLHLVYLTLVYPKTLLTRPSVVNNCHYIVLILSDPSNTRYSRHIHGEQTSLDQPDTTYFLNDLLMFSTLSKYT